MAELGAVLENLKVATTYAKAAMRTVRFGASLAIRARGIFFVALITTPGSSAEPGRRRRSIGLKSRAATSRDPVAGSGTARRVGRAGETSAGEVRL